MLPGGRPGSYGAGGAFAATGGPASNPYGAFSDQQLGGAPYKAEWPNSYASRQRTFGSQHSILRSGGIGMEQGPFKKRVRVKAWELILVPWATLVLVLITYLLGGAHGKTVPLWLVPGILLILSSAFVRWHYKAGQNAEVALGCLCIAGVAIGLTLGIYALFHSLKEYHRLSRGASYFNVLPAEAALGKADATTFVFTNHTVVDLGRTFGYVDALGSSPVTYCVAPVASALQGTQSRVEYWAVGTDCCQNRGSFSCGSAATADAHGGVVLARPTQLLPGFKAAIKGAERAYGLKASENFMLLDWSEDPIAYRDNLYSSMSNLFLVFSCVYFVVSAMMGCALMPVIIST